MKFLVCCATLLLVSAGAVARAGDCCHHCGCQCTCNKVCRVVCETKKVTKPEYDCECEEFCIPGKSECCVTFDECGKKQKVYSPTCGKVRTRVKLVKTMKTEEVKTYRWVVEDLCANCAKACEGQHALPPPSGASLSQPGTIEPVGFTLPSAASPDANSVAETEQAANSKSPLERALRPLFGSR